MKKNKIKCLVALAYSDGCFDIEELDFINKRAIAEGLTNNEIIEVLQNPYSVDFTMPITNKEKFEFLFDMMGLIHADGKVDLNEKKMFSKYLIHLGYSSEFHEELFLSYSNAITNDISFKEFYTKIKAK